jgi:hypothetical protein
VKKHRESDSGSTYTVSVHSICAAQTTATSRQWEGSSVCRFVNYRSSQEKQGPESLDSQTQAREFCKFVTGSFCLLLFRNYEQRVKRPFISVVYLVSKADSNHPLVTRTIPLLKQRNITFLIRSSHSVLHRPTRRDAKNSLHYECAQYELRGSLRRLVQQFHDE